MEIWKDINGYEGHYQVSNLGRVKSLKREVLNNRPVEEKIISGHKGTGGYLQMALSKNGFKKYYMIHRLVAEHFKDNPKGLKQVNHLDYDKTNNRAENLEWCTQSENMKHSYAQPNRSKARGWQGKYGASHNRSKKVYEFNEKGELLNTYESGLDFQRKTGVSDSAIIWAIKNNRPIFGKYYSRTNHYQMGK